MPIHGLENYARQTNPKHFDIEAVIRPNILTLHPYRCARDDYQSGILLDANENALGHSIDFSNDSSIIDSYADTDLHRYPDPAQTEIKTRIADLRQMPGTDHVFLGVGSDEVIDLLIRVCCTPGVDKILTTPPTYGMYAVCAQVNDVPIVKVPLSGTFQLSIDEIKRSVASDPSIKLIFLCSPGNPTGTVLPLSDIRQILDDANFKGVVVVDEAYIDFASANSSAAQLVHEYANICVLQTLSKSFGLAAIRLGIALAQPPLIQILTNTKAPYNISTPSSILALQALSPASLKNMQDKIMSLRTARSELVSALAPFSKLGLASPLGGNDANFLLVPVLDREGGTPDNTRALKIYRELAEHRGVVVRFRGDQWGCQGCLRITVGSPQENKVLVQQLETALLAL
ncbi:pyridoxal phosphate-dependent transferase [Gautieria morchelliformis]|nr:pyridoxal phosphate-dependent transferase [Gautieria morchelliformis]